MYKGVEKNNGGELCGNEFEHFYKQCGVARKKPTPYTPQQNGVVGRMSRGFMEIVRMLGDA